MIPDDYSITETIRAGRETVLYRALQGPESRIVAVKVLKHPDTGLESQIRAVLEAVPVHPNLITSQHVGLTRERRLFAAMTYYPLGSLADALREHGLTTGRYAAALGATIADALEAAHRQGAVHGDMRPAAVLADPFQGPVVSGFGFGLLRRGDRREARRLVHWAPELLEGEEPTRAADVYGLAATLCTLMTGTPHRLAAAERGLGVLLAETLSGDPPGLPGDLTPKLREVIVAALSPDPGQRPATAAEFGRGLRDALHEPFPTPFPTPIPPAPAPVPVPVPAPVPAPVLAPALEQAPVSATPGAGARYGLVVAAVALAVVAGVALLRPVSGAGAALSTPSAAPDVRRTEQAPPVTKLDQSRYQPQRLNSRPGPGQILLSWDLPADAQSDGAGIIIRESPALSGGGTVALSRQGGLPHSYVAAPAPAGQQVCFMVGVLVERTTGGPTLVQTGPTCATAR